MEQFDWEMLQGLAMACFFGLGLAFSNIKQEDESESPTLRTAIFLLLSVIFTLAGFAILIYAASGMNQP